MAGRRKYFDHRYMFMRGLIANEQMQRARHYLKSVAECTSKAIVSLELSDKAVKTPKQASRLEGIGKETVRSLEQCVESERFSPDCPAPGRYVSSAGALLVALLNLTEKALQESESDVALIAEIDLRREGAKISDEPFSPVGSHGVCKAWWRLEVLIKRDLVKRRSLHKATVYHLLPRGTEAATALRGRSLGQGQGQNQGQDTAVDSAGPEKKPRDLSLKTTKARKRKLETETPSVAAPVEKKASGVAVSVPSSSTSVSPGESEGPKQLEIPEETYGNDTGKDGVVLLVDNQECGGIRHGLPELCEMLDQTNMVYKVQRLPCSGYTWLWRCDGVERPLPQLFQRKRADDVANFLKDGLFWKQISQMVSQKGEFNAKGVEALVQYILEGKPEDFVSRCADRCQGVGRCGNPTLEQVQRVLENLKEHPEMEVLRFDSILDTVAFLNTCYLSLSQRVAKGEFDALVVAELTQKVEKRDNKAKVETAVIIVEEEEEEDRVSGTTKPFTSPNPQYSDRGDNSEGLVIIAEDELPPLVHPRRGGCAPPEGVNTESGSVGYNSIITGCRVESSNAVGGGSSSSPVAAKWDRCRQPLHHHPSASSAHATHPHSSAIHPRDSAVSAHPLPSESRSADAVRVDDGDDDDDGPSSFVTAHREPTQLHHRCHPYDSPFGPHHLDHHHHHRRHHNHHSPSGASRSSLVDQTLTLSQHHDHNHHNHHHHHHHQSSSSPHHHHPHPPHHHQPSHHHHHAPAASSPSTAASSGGSSPARVNGAGDSTGGASGGGGGGGGGGERRRHATAPSPGSPLGRVYLMKRTPRQQQQQSRGGSPASQGVVGGKPSPTLDDSGNGRRWAAGAGGRGCRKSGEVPFGADPEGLTTASGLGLGETGQSSSSRGSKESGQISPSRFCGKTAADCTSGLGQGGSCGSKETGQISSSCGSNETGQISPSRLCGKTAACAISPTLPVSLLTYEREEKTGSRGVRGEEEEEEVGTEEGTERMETTVIFVKENEPGKEKEKGYWKEAEATETLKRRKKGNDCEKEGREDGGGGKLQKTDKEAGKKGEPGEGWGARDWDEKSREDTDEDEWSLPPLVKGRRGRGEGDESPPTLTSGDSQGAEDNASTGEAFEGEGAVSQRPRCGSLRHPSFGQGRLFSHSSKTTASAADTDPTTTTTATTSASTCPRSFSSPLKALPWQRPTIQRGCQSETSITPPDEQAAWNRGSFSCGSNGISSYNSSGRRSTVQPRDNSPLRGGGFTSLVRGKQLTVTQSSAKDGGSIQTPSSSSSSSSWGAVESTTPFWTSSHDNEDDSAASALYKGGRHSPSPLSSSSLEAAELTESHLVSTFVTGSSVDGDGCDDSREGGVSPPGPHSPPLSPPPPHSPPLSPPLLSCLGDPLRPHEGQEEMGSTQPSVFQRSPSYSPPLPAPPFPSCHGYICIEDDDSEEEEGEQNEEKKTLQPDSISSSTSGHRRSFSATKEKKTLQPESVSSSPPPSSTSSSRRRRSISPSRVGVSSGIVGERHEEYSGLPDLDSSWSRREDNADSSKRRRDGRGPRQEREATQWLRGNRSPEEEEEDAESREDVRGHPLPFSSPLSPPTPSSSSSSGAQLGGKIAQIAAVLPQMTVGEIKAVLRRFDGDVERCVIAVLDGDPGLT